MAQSAVIYRSGSVYYTAEAAPAEAVQVAAYEYAQTVRLSGTAVDGYIYTIGGYSSGGTTTTQVTLKRYTLPDGTYVSVVGTNPFRSGTGLSEKVKIVVRYPYATRNCSNCFDGSKEYQSRVDVDYSSASSSTVNNIASNLNTDTVGNYKVNEYYIGYKASVSDIVICCGIRNFISYDANGGSFETDMNPYSRSGKKYGSNVYNNLSPYSAGQKLRKNHCVRDGYAFAGWNSKADGTGTAFADEADAQSFVNGTLNAMRTLYAQWRNVQFTLTATKRSSGFENADAGTLTLEKDGATVATEVNRVVNYTGTVDGSYRLVCTMSDGFTLPAQAISPEEGQTLTVDYIVPLVSVLTHSDSSYAMSVVQPSSPDALSANSEPLYVAGRNITVDCETEDEEKFLSRGLLYESASSQTPFAEFSGDSIAFSEGVYSFTIAGLNRSCYVRGEISTKTYGVTCAADPASAGAFTAFSVTVDGSPVTTAEKGDSVVFTATLASGYSFEGFYLGGQKLDGASGSSITIAIDGATSLVAKAQVSVALSVYDGGGTITVNGGEYVPDTEFYVTLGSSFAYAFAPSGERRFRGWYEPGYPTTKTRLPMAQSGEIAPTAAINAVGVALVGGHVDGDELRVSIGYVDDEYSAVTSGRLTIDGEESLVVIRTYSETNPPSVVLRADALNGYEFAGWFEDASGYGTPKSAASVYEVELDDDLELYAKFVKNRHSICEWEGDSKPKSMEWRSKTYAASKPFNPSACRVDALGYPPGYVAGTEVPKVLELTVDMFSAPDAAATATARLTNIANQDARRLPVRRMERYMQVAVKANTEIDTLLVGTAMEGLAT